MVLFQSFFHLDIGAEIPGFLCLCLCIAVCDGGPSSIILPNGTWPTNCSNSVFVTGTCKGVCSGTLQGNPTVECLGGGTWSISVKGRCVDGPSKCEAEQCV